MSSRTEHNALLDLILFSGREAFTLDRDSHHVVSWVLVGFVILVISLVKLVIIN